MKNLLKILGILAIAHAACEASTRPHLEFSAYVGGSYIPNTMEGEELELLPYEVGPYADTFTNQSSAWAFTWGLESKYRFKLSPSPGVNNIFSNLGVGINVFQITNFDQTGDVLQYGMSEFKNYTYTLELKNTRVMADMDVVFHTFMHDLCPFIQLGLGAAATSVSYKSSPIPPIEGPDFTLPNKVSWTFAYQAGAGLKYAVNNHFLVSVRYLYAGMGSVDTSTSGNLTSLASPLNVDMSTQNFLLGFTYEM